MSHGTACENCLEARHMTQAVHLQEPAKDPKRPCEPPAVLADRHFLLPLSCFVLLSPLRKPPVLRDRRTQDVHLLLYSSALLPPIGAGSLRGSRRYPGRLPAARLHCCQGPATILQAFSIVSSCVAHGSAGVSDDAASCSGHCSTFLFTPKAACSLQQDILNFRHTLSPGAGPLQKPLQDCFGRQGSHKERCQLPSNDPKQAAAAVCSSAAGLGSEPVRRGLCLTALPLLPWCHAAGRSSVLQADSCMTFHACLLPCYP